MVSSGFRGLNDHVNALVPSHEDIDAAIHRENPLLPRIAIREFLANALIHPDMTMTGPVVKTLHRLDDRRRIGRQSGRDLDRV